MQLEPTDSKWWLPAVLSAVIGVLFSVVAWIWARMVGQQDRHTKKLSELDAYLAEFMAKKGDIEYLAKRIDETNDALAENEKKTSVFRHDLRTETQHQSMVLYLLAKKADIDLPPRENRN